MRLLPDSQLTSAEPVLLVRWCIDKSEAEELKRFEAKNIHVLFVIAYEGAKLEERQLVPLDNMAAFLTFNRPGTHTVFARVVWDRANRLEETILSKYNQGSYQFQALNYYHTGFSSREAFNNAGVRHLQSDADFEIEIPKEHFPKDPPAWLARPVNAGFQYPPVDQCAFRRRLLSAPIKLFFMGLWAAITTIIRALIALWWTLFLARETNYAAVIHPWRWTIRDVGKYSNPFDTWFSHIDEDRRFRTSKWILVFHPMLYLLSFIAFRIIAVHHHMTNRQLIHVIAAAIASVAVWVLAKTLVMLSIGLSGAVVLYFLVQYLKTEKRKRLEWENSKEYKAEQKRRELKQYDDLALLLACRPGIDATLESLPADHLTLYLRFRALKRELCRPYAKN